ncbi:uncharacterized protein THITE_2122657 [Thermothielavioides terrestris NRRL 8126]|uniref:Uncharacterized protein n=1 Tax=Thermothielavioides terrestris (strain ATCC 38088 / NRRL 8126) TaxID=578455 RepID=G2RDW4_THETT|nr:uncharacterized protein THITE_2122657 [Thermothielavioides terrestris NRRL 8126]AEO70847.1 hypothetical protein THITE_2122657 [Thermothielavioides terrestris NRRL 8126]
MAKDNPFEQNAVLSRRVNYLVSTFANRLLHHSRFQPLVPDMDFIWRFESRRKLLSPLVTALTTSR